MDSNNQYYVPGGNNMYYQPGGNNAYYQQGGNQQYYQQDPQQDNDEDSSMSFNPLEWIFTFLHYWYLFVIAIVIALGLAALKNRRWIPTYFSQGTIVIKESSTYGGSASALMQASANAPSLPQHAVPSPLQLHLEFVSLCYLILTLRWLSRYDSDLLLGFQPALFL